MNTEFVRKHTKFAKGADDIGYGLRPDNPLEMKAKNASSANTWSDIDFEQFAAFVKPYTLERTAEETGVPAERLKALAELYADPKRKVMSFWTMGFNQHTRGVWANNLIYNIHLLTGKISEPGNSPFSLTGQPSACGTAAKWARSPTACLPIWWSPTPNTAPRPKKSGSCRPAPFRKKSVSTPCNRAACSRTAYSTFTGPRPVTICRPGPTSCRKCCPGWRNPDNFVIVSDVYPTVSAQAADLILPSAMWVEKEGAYGNAERRTQFWHQLVSAPGEAKSDLWQLVEFSKRFTTDEVWPAELLAKSPEHKGKTLYQVLFANGQVDQFPNEQIAEGHINDEAKAFGFYLQKGLFEEYAELRPRPRPRPGAVRHFTTRRVACAGRWWTAKETRWRYREGLRSLMWSQVQRGAVLRQRGRQGGDHLRRALRAGGGSAR